MVCGLLHFALITILANLAHLAFGVRQAPFCIDEQEVDAQNFKPIFDHYNSNPKEFVPVSPDTYRSPTGFINNVTMSHIVIKSIPEKHPYKIFRNYFHMSIIAAAQSEGMEGLYIQSISAPLGVPFGEFIIDFDCGDCPRPTSSLHLTAAVIPCKYRPAASYLFPQTLVIGGKQPTPNKFHEAHFHFRYVDYPCYDVVFAQFLIIAVRTFRPTLEYEVFYTSLYKVNIEGVGAPYPMYYGWPPSNILCHGLNFSSFRDENWRPLKNQKAKIKFSKEYEKCLKENKSPLGPGNVCPPGPVTCSNQHGMNDPPRSFSQWISLRQSYRQKKGQQQTGTGDDIYCVDCGMWHDRIGVGTWPSPPVISLDPPQYAEDEDELAVTQAPEQDVIYSRRPWVYDPSNYSNCEVRDQYGKNVNGERDITKFKGCFNTTEERLAQIGWRWGKSGLQIHGLLMIFAWTVGANCFIYCARFLKEVTIMEKRTGCFSIGNWLWVHMIWVYLAIMAIWAATFMLVMIPDLGPLCKVYSEAANTEFCMVWGGWHKLGGGSAFVIFHMGYATGWTRPQSSGLLRNLWILYHAGCGYLSKIIGLLCLLTAPFNYNKIPIILSEVTFFVFFLIGTFLQLAMDTSVGIKRRCCPVPEAIDTFIEPPMHNVRRFLYPLFCIVQLGLFGWQCFETWSRY